MANRPCGSNITTHKDETLCRSYITVSANAIVESSQTICYLIFRVIQKHSSFMHIEWILGTTQIECLTIMEQKHPTKQ